MRKTIAVLTIFLYLTTLTFTVNAQTTGSPTPNPQDTPNLMGQVIPVVGLVVVFAVLGYAGYKLVKKWSSSSD